MGLITDSWVCVTSSVKIKFPKASARLPEAGAAVLNGLCTRPPPTKLHRVSGTMSVMTPVLFSRAAESTESPFGAPQMPPPALGRRQPSEHEILLEPRSSLGRQPEPAGRWHRTVCR